jgi:hypothetical protein
MYDSNEKGGRKGRGSEYRCGSNVLTSHTRISAITDVDKNPRSPSEPDRAATGGPISEKVLDKLG